MSKPHLLLFASLLLGACGEPAPAQEPAEPQRARVESPEAGGMPAMNPSEVERLEGAVAEVLSAGRYTYVRLDTEAGPRWAVSMGELELDTGAEAAFVIHAQRRDFHSRILDRDFDQLFFGQLAQS